MNRRLRSWAGFLFLIIPFSVRADVRTGVEQTAGSQHYRSTKVSADVGGTVRFSSAFESLRSDASSGTYRTYSLGLGYRGQRWQAGAVGGVTPEVDKYSNEFLGAEAGWRFPSPIMTPKAGGSGRDDLRGEESENASSGVEAGVLRIVHTDRSRSLTGSRKGPFIEAGQASDVVQTDFYLSTDFVMRYASVNAKVSRSRYGRELQNISETEARRIVPRGEDFITRGFPSASCTAGLELTFLPGLAPYASFTYVAYALDAPPARTLEVGFETSIKGVGVDLSFEPYARGGEDPVYGYVTLGLSYKFK